MRRRLDPRLDRLTAEQREIWDQLKPAQDLGYVLYGGTGISLQLGHRASVDFDFFAAEPMDKGSLRRRFGFVPGAAVIQDMPETLVLLAAMPSGPVKVSFFGGLAIGRVRQPLRTLDGVLLVASLDDLMATKLKAILDRAEAKDYRDIAALLGAGVSLPRGLAAFRRMFPGGEPAEVLRALGYFEDGDLPTLGEDDRRILWTARDQVGDLPDLQLIPGSLVGA